jgi:hypothetical protein
METGGQDGQNAENWRRNRTTIFFALTASEPFARNHDVVEAYLVEINDASGKSTLISGL